MSATAEVELGDDLASAQAPAGVLWATVVCWAGAAAAAVVAPFGAFFISLGETGRGLRNQVVFNGWGEVNGKYADLIDGGFPIYGAALALWSGVLLIAVGLMVRLHLRAAAAPTPPVGPLVLGLIGSAGLAAYAGVVWLAGRAWTSNQTTYRGRTLAEGALGNGHRLALAAGIIALVAVGMTLICLRHGDGWDRIRRRARPRWVQPVLVVLSIAVAVLVVAAPFATYFSVQVTSFGDTLNEYSTDGWGRLETADRFNPSAHEVRFGVIQAVAAGLLFVGTALLVARPRWRRAGAVVSSLGHVVVLATALGMGVVTYSWLTRTDSEDLQQVGHIGLGSWALAVAALASLSWLTVACWPLLPTSLTRLVVFHQPSIDAQATAEADESLVEPPLLQVESGDEQPVAEIAPESVSQPARGSGGGRTTEPRPSAGSVPPPPPSDDTVTF